MDPMLMALVAGGAINLLIWVVIIVVIVAVVMALLRRGPRL
jgi:hypothetical protein